MSSYKPCKANDCHNLIDRELTRQYCSDACRQRAYRARKDSVAKVPQVALRKQCYNCGKFFPTFNKRQRFCKVSCRVSYHQQQIRFATKDLGVLPTK